MKNEIILGCMRISEKSVEEVEKLILCAVENNITFFDHADIYGRRKCEELFGEVLKRNKGLREKIRIQSKCGIARGYYNSSKEYIINQTLESIRLLNCEYLDSLLIHRPDALMDYNEVNEAFNYLYDNGYVKSFGVSNMNSWQIELLNKHLDHKIQYNQLQLSIVHSHLISQGFYVNTSEEESLDRSSGLLEYCELNDIKVQAWSVLMASWEDGSFIDNPKYPELNEVLEELANKYGVYKNTIAVSFILRHPFGINPIVGTTSIDHLKEIALAKNIELTREEWYRLYKSSGHSLP